MAEKMTEDQEKKVNEAFEQIKNGSFTDDDTSTVLNNTTSIINKTKAGPLLKFADDVKLMCAMVKAWSKKDYTGLPVKTITMVILTLVYVFSPVDVIPDFIPVMGLLDDAGMVAACLAAVHSDLESFKNWALKNKPEYVD